VETFTRLFGSLLLFVYHCFDRVVINGYLSGLSRPAQVAYFFHNVVGEPVICKEVLSRRTNEYQAWVEAFARNHAPIEWAEPKVRKEDYVRPALRRMERANQHGVYFILVGSRTGARIRTYPLEFCTSLAEYFLRCTLKPGAGTDLPFHGSPLCDLRSQLPHSGAPA